MRFKKITARDRVLAQIPKVQPINQSILRKVLSMPASSIAKHLVDLEELGIIRKVDDRGVFDTNCKVAWVRV